MSSKKAGSWEATEPLLPGHAQEPKSAEHLHEEHLRQSSWFNTSFIIAGEIVGTGIMGLPFAISQLGWIVGIGSAALFGLMAWYSGILLSRVKNEMSPESRSYAEAARTLIGPRFGTFTQYAIWTNWLLLTPYYLMAAANALVLAYDLCYWQWAAILSIALFAFAQLRTLHALRIPALVSIASVLIVLFVIMIEFGVQSKGTPLPSTRLWPVTANATFLSQYNHFSSYIFAYQGQSMFLEIQREMKDSTEFPKALGVANIFMFLLYSITSAVAYYYKGADVSGFLPDSVSALGPRIIIAIALTYHVIIAYMLTAQPLADQIYRKLFPSRIGDLGYGGQIRWAAIQGFVLIFAYFIANSIPFFSDFTNIMGAALGAPITFGWPAIFYLYGMRRANRTVPLVDKIVCAVFLVVLLPFCTSVGVVSAIKGLISDWGTFGKPFACHLVGY